MKKKRQYIRRDHPKRKPPPYVRPNMKRQTPAQLAAAIERVVRKAENKAAKILDGEQWFYRKEYRQ